MKSRFRLFVKFLSLLIVVSCFAFGLYAQKKHSNLLTLNTETSKYKPLAKTDQQSPQKLASEDTREIIEEKQKLEEWMFDNKFWQIVQNDEWNEEPIEEQSLAEDWMSIFNLLLKTVLQWALH